VVLEIAVIEVTPGSEDAFLAGYEQVKGEVAGSPGVRTMRLTRGVESPSRFVLMVEWDDIAAHEAFRASDGFGRWRAGIGPHFAAPPQVEHYRDAG
jgi:heme-degrading monooxygenase HmoA